MITALDTPDNDPYAEYRTQYKAVMTEVVNVLVNSSRFNNRKG